MSALTQLQRTAAGKAQADPETVARVQFLKSMQAELDYAIPPAVKKVLTPDRMCRLAVTAMRQVRNLNQCTFESLAGALMVAAQLGLEPCTPLGQCYLIPRKNGKTGQYEATFQIGYQGMLELAYRTETVKSVTAKSVHYNDEFIYEEGLDDKLIHRPFLGGDRGIVIAYYAIIKFVNGGHAFDVMSHPDMVVHMDRFAPRDWKTNQVTGPWSTDFDEMACKTMIRRLFKMMRKSTDTIAKATLYDERVIDRSMNDKELRLNFDPPPVAALPPQNQQEEEDPEELNEPESEQEQPPAPAPKAQPARTRRKTSADPKASDMKVISETGVKLVEVPFDIEPETQKPEVKSSSLGDTIIAIEKWAKAAAVKHDQDGLPDLSDPGYLMERVYEVLAQRGLVDPRADSWYSWLNQIAKLTGSSEEVVDLLVKVNKQVRDEYAGVPDEVLVADEEGPVANDPPAESHGQRVAAIEAWMTKAVDQFAAKGVEGFAKPSDVLEAMYSVAVKQGLVKGKSAGWRPRVTDLAESKVSIHDLTQIFAAEARAIVQHYASDNGGREPGSEG